MPDDDPKFIDIEDEPKFVDIEPPKKAAPKSNRSPLPGAIAGPLTTAADPGNMPALATRVAAGAAPWLVQRALPGAAKVSGVSGPLAAGALLAMEQPFETAWAGLPGAGVAKGANTAVDIGNALPTPEGMLEVLPQGLPKVERPFKHTLDSILPKPRTADAALLGTVAEIGTGLAMGAGTTLRQEKNMKLAADVASKEAQYERLSNSLKAEPDELKAAHNARIKAIQDEGKGWAEVVQREIDSADNKFPAETKPIIAQSRTRARDFFKSWGEKFDRQLDGAVQRGGPIEPGDAGALAEHLESAIPGVRDRVRMGLPVQPGERQVLKLIQALQPEEGQPLSDVRQVWDALYKKFNATNRDYAIGKAKNIFSRYLADRGDSLALQVRATYGPMADLRDKAYDILRPFDGPNETASTVNTLHQLVKADSAIEGAPAGGGATQDFRDFLSQYAKVDPDLVRHLSRNAEARRMANMTVKQVMAQADNKAMQMDGQFQERLQQSLEKAEETRARLMQDVANAKTAVEKALASEKLRSWVAKALGIVAGSVATGYGARLGWRIASKIVGPTSTGGD